MDIWQTDRYGYIDRYTMTDKINNISIAIRYNSKSKITVCEYSLLTINMFEESFSPWINYVFHCDQSDISHVIMNDTCSGYWLTWVGGGADMCSPSFVSSFLCPPLFCVLPFLCPPLFCVLPLFLFFPFFVSSPFLCPPLFCVLPLFVSSPFFVSSPYLAVSPSFFPCATPPPPTFLFYRKHMEQKIRCPEICFNCVFNCAFLNANAEPSL